MKFVRDNQKGYRRAAKETMSQSHSNYDIKKYFGYHPLVNNKVKDRHASSAAKLAAGIRRQNESVQSFESQDSKGYRHSARSQGGGLATRNFNHRGGLDGPGAGGRVTLKTGRAYDAVAESLHRIQQKLQGGKKNREEFLHGRVSKLVRRHSALSDCGRRWDQSQHDENEDNLLKNCQKAELGYKHQKAKGTRNQALSTKLSNTHYDRLTRYRAGADTMNQNLKNYQNQVRNKHKNQSMNTTQTKELLRQHNEAKKEENYMRQYDVSANKFKEDVKFDNFKKHTVGKHNTHGL